MPMETPEEFAVAAIEVATCPASEGNRAAEIAANLRQREAARCTMTRAEADAMVSEYDDAERIYRQEVRMCAGSGATVDRTFHRMNALRERLIDQLCGEERTEPMAGRLL